MQLTEAQVVALDVLAARRRVSRSALIRSAVDGILADDRERHLAEEIVAGYRRIPPGEPDAWGDVEAALDQNTLETLQRVADEERRAGTAPW